MNLPKTQVVATYTKDGVDVHIEGQTKHIPLHNAKLMMEDDEWPASGLLDCVSEGALAMGYYLTEYPLRHGELKSFTAVRCKDVHQATGTFDPR